MNHDLDLSEERSYSYMFDKCKSIDTIRDDLLDKILMGQLHVFYIMNYLLFIYYYYYFFLKREREYSMIYHTEREKEKREKEKCENNKKIKTCPKMRKCPRE